MKQIKKKNKLLEISNNINRIETDLQLPEFEENIDTFPKTYPQKIHN